MAPIGGDKSEATNPPLRHAEHALTERRGVKPVADIEPRAPGFEFTRRHRLNVDKKVVKASGAGKAGIVGCVEHAMRVAERPFGMFQGQELNEALGTDPRPAPEQSLKMKFAQIHAFCHLA